MDQVFRDLEPEAGEAAVLSLLAIRDGNRWAVVSGSLLSVPDEVAQMGWVDWANRQPLTRGPRDISPSPDFGASFSEDPFPDIRLLRTVVGSNDWRSRVEELEAGSLSLNDETFRLDFEGLSACKLYTQDGLSDAHRAIAGAKRPVRGVSLDLKGEGMPPSQAIWVVGGSSKPFMKQTRDELQGKETIHEWPMKLLGVDWLGSSEFAPPRCFVVGELQSAIWIADVVPDYENEQIRIVLAWDAERIDPLSCSVLLRGERGGGTLLARHWKISDLPGEGQATKEGKESRDLAWSERTLDIRLPRGARRTEVGVSLFGPDGWLMDERPVVRRVEQIEMEIGIKGTSEPFSKSVIGDPDPPPTEAERDRAVKAARELEERTRAVAASRRLATTGQLKKYLRWRFSARAGELLILDRYLFDRKEVAEIEEVADFLEEFKRPIRALVSKNSPAAKKLLDSRPGIEVRKTSSKNFHDRLWIAGEAAVLVGTSVNQFLQTGSVAATTAVDLPHADSAAWRDLFEEWWLKARPLE